VSAPEIVIPEIVKQKIASIQQKTGIGYDEILRDYKSILSDPFITNDPQFKSDVERQKYASAVLWTRYVARPPMRENDIIPWGCEGERITRKGKPQSSVYAFVKTKSGIVPKRIVLSGPIASKVRDIVRDAKYTVKLGEFQQGGDMIADNRSHFENPVMINMSSESLVQRLGATRVELKDVHANNKNALSKTDSKGYVITTDLKVVRGIMVRPTTWERDDHTKGGVFTLANDTLEQEATVGADGTVQTPGLTCWTAPHLLIYQPESEVDAIGTIRRKDKESTEVNMNCYRILPVHARSLPSQD